MILVLCLILGIIFYSKRIFSYSIFPEILITISSIVLLIYLTIISIIIFDTKKICDVYPVYKNYYENLNVNDNKNIAAINKIYEFNEDVISYKWMINNSPFKNTWKIFVDKRISDLEVIK